MNVSSPIDGSPVTVVSDTTASTVVSRSVIDCCGHNSGHDRPASGLSAHAAIAATTAPPIKSPKVFLCKTISPVHRRSSECGVNAFGNSSSSVQRASRPSRVNATTTRCGENSSMTCRQIPHGGVGSSASVAITTASKLRFPRATAADTALRSAQIPAGNEAFSTLQPSVMLPSVASRAAPTLKFEYGA